MRSSRDKARLFGHIVAAYLVVGFLLEGLALSLAWNMGDWVGGGPDPGPPVRAVITVFMPPAIGFLLGLSCVVICSVHRLAWGILEGVFVILGALVLAALAGWSLAMGHIT